MNKSEMQWIYELNLPKRSD